MADVLITADQIIVLIQGLKTHPGINSPNLILGLSPRF